MYVGEEVCRSVSVIMINTVPNQTKNLQHAVMIHKWEILTSNYIHIQAYSTVPLMVHTMSMPGQYNASK